jgi:hypothetical protein
MLEVSIKALESSKTKNPPNIPDCEIREAALHFGCFYSRWCSPVDLKV